MAERERKKLTLVSRFLFKGVDGEPIYLLGVNYWPRKTGQLMWSNWDPEELNAELKQMKNMGMNVCRSFLYLPDFMPTPDGVDEVMLDRFCDFLDICADVGISTIPSFMVGHMSGEDWDLPWRDGKNLYEDEYMLDKQAELVRTVVKRANRHPAIAAWVLSNEMPNYGGEGPRGAVKKWVSTLTNAVREAGDERPVSPGDGVWSPEIWGNSTEWHIKDIIDDVDFLGPHIYPMETDWLRHSYIPAFSVKMASVWGKPVILEEFGASNTMASEENQGAYFRTTLNSVFLNGGVGALGWCYSNFDLENQRPYSHRGHEFSFGVTRVDGSVKPSGEAFDGFRKNLESLNLSETTIHEDPVEILVPSYYHDSYPYNPSNRRMMKEIFKQTFVCLKQAGINPDFIFEKGVGWDKISGNETPDVDTKAEIIFSPVTRRLTAPYWNSLRSYVERGGCLYVSYGSDGWVHCFEEMFGASHKLRFGLVDIPDDQISIRFLSDFGGIGEGETLDFSIPGDDRLSAFCPLIPDSGIVLAEDAGGRPALLSNRIGDGQVFFSAFPLEYYVSTFPDGSVHQPLYLLYRALCREAGVIPPLSPDNPRIEIGILKSDTDKLTAYMINHSWEEEIVTVSSSATMKGANPVMPEEKIEIKDDSFTVKIEPKNTILVNVFT